MWGVVTSARETRWCGTPAMVSYPLALSLPGLGRASHWTGSQTYPLLTITMLSWWWWTCSQKWYCSSLPRNPWEPQRWPPSSHSTWVSPHGLLDTLVSDRDPVFTSHFWRRLLELCGIRANRSTAFHPQTDGQTERLNSVLKQYLRIYTDYQQSNWASLLPLAEFSYNNSRHSATTISPFFANYGFHPRMSLLPLALASRTPASNSYVAQFGRPKIFCNGNSSNPAKLWRFRPIGNADRLHPSSWVNKYGC